MDIIFDFDGVIMDSSLSVVNRIRQMANEFGHFKEVAGRDLTEYIGWTALSTCKDLFKDKVEPHKIEAMAERILRLFWERPIKEAVLYCDIERVLQELIIKKSAYLYIITGRPLNATIALLNYYGLQKYFAEVLSSSSRHETKSETVKYLLGKGEIDKGDCFFIGDRDIDAEAAISNNLLFIGAMWGFGGGDSFAKELASDRVYSADKPADIIKVINIIRMGRDGD